MSDPDLLKIDIQNLRRRISEIEDRLLKVEDKVLDSAEKAERAHKGVFTMTISGDLHNAGLSHEQADAIADAMIRVVERFREQ